MVVGAAQTARLSRQDQRPDNADPVAQHYRQVGDPVAHQVAHDEWIVVGEVGEDHQGRVSRGPPRSCAPCAAVDERVAGPGQGGVEAVAERTGAVQADAKGLGRRRGHGLDGVQQSRDRHEIGVVEPDFAQPGPQVSRAVACIEGVEQLGNRLRADRRREFDEQAALRIAADLQLVVAADEHRLAGVWLAGRVLPGVKPVIASRYGELAGVVKRLARPRT